MSKVLKSSLNIFLIFFIFILTILLRAFYLNRINGLTLDELSFYNNLFNLKDLISWKDILFGENIFSLPVFIDSFFKTFVGTGDLGLRILSVFFGVLTCFAAYFTENKQQGLLCLFLFSINSLLINYSQEVGIYSLLGLFSVLNIVCLLKIKNDDNGYLLWIISVAGLVLTSVFSILFLILEVCIFYVYQKNKKFINSFLYSCLILCPYYLYLIFNYKNCLSFYADINYDYANIFAMLQNLFSPRLITLSLDNLVRYFNSLFLDASFYTLVFIWIPVVVALYFIFIAFIKNKFNIILFSICLLYTLLRVFLQILFGISFEVGEYILILPFFLIIISYGIEKNYVSIFLLILFVLSNMYYLVMQDNSAMKNTRHSVLAISDIINMSAKDNDVVVTWVDIGGLDKLVYKKIKVFNVYDVYIKNSEEILNNKQITKKLSSKKRKDLYRKYFLNTLYSKDIVSKTNILMGNVSKGSRIFFIYPKKYDIDFYAFLDIVSKDYLYYNYTEKDLFFIQSISQIDKILMDLYVNKTEKDNLVVIIYKK